MRTISSTTRKNVTIMAESDVMLGVNIQINFESLTGAAPAQITGTASIAAPVVAGQPQEQPTYINFNRQANGQKTTSMSGKGEVAEFIDMITEVNLAIENIAATEGGVA